MNTKVREAKIVEMSSTHNTTKGTNKAPITKKKKKMEICELSKNSEIILLKKFRSYKNTQIENKMKLAKQYMNKMKSSTKNTSHTHTKKQKS